MTSVRHSCTQPITRSHTKVSHRKDDRRTITLTRIISPERRIAVMNDGVFIGRHLATSPNGIWLAVCHGQLSVSRGRVLRFDCSWSSPSYPRVYLFSLVPPFPTHPILAVTVRVHVDDIPRSNGSRYIQRNVMFKLVWPKTLVSR